MKIPMFKKFLAVWALGEMLLAGYFLISFFGKFQDIAISVFPSMDSFVFSRCLAGLSVVLFVVVCLLRNKIEQILYC